MPTILLICEGQLGPRAVDELATAAEVYGLLDDLGDPKIPGGTQPGPQFGCAGRLCLCVANYSSVVAGGVLLVFVWVWCGWCWVG